MERQKYIDDIIKDLAAHTGIPNIIIDIQYIQLYDTTVDLYRLCKKSYDEPTKEDNIEIQDRCMDIIFDRYA